MIDEVVDFISRVAKEDPEGIVFEEPSCYSIPVSGFSISVSLIVDKYYSTGVSVFDVHTKPVLTFRILGSELYESVRGAYLTDRGVHSLEDKPGRSFRMLSNAMYSYFTLDRDC